MSLRLGALTLDLDGLTPALPLPATAGTAWERLRPRFDSRASAGFDVGFFDAPETDAISARAACVEFAHRLRARPHALTDCLWIGIGGSALGPIALLESLEHRAPSQGLRFHFAENPDPIDWQLTLGRLKPETTHVVGVTKSGGTFETLALWTRAMAWLGEARMRSHTLLLTDPERGEAGRWARSQRIECLPIHPSLGGRFSAFGSVGVAALELAGLSSEAFLAGAGEVRRDFLSAPTGLSALAHAIAAAATSHPIHVCMPYSSRLRRLGQWFVQLWGESLGKQGQGLTPVAAVGAIDQHSLLQLLRDGPNDKVTTLIRVLDWHQELASPGTQSRAPWPVDPSFPNLHRLARCGLGELLAIEHDAIRQVLRANQRPQLGIEIPTLDERSLGALLFTLALLTALTGAAMGVDPFDQPGVEEGKRYIERALAEAAPGSGR